MGRLIWRRYLELQGESPTSFNVEAASNLELTRELFDDLCTQQGFIEALRELDISDDNQLDLFDTLDADGLGKVSLSDFVTGIRKLRGDARKADIVYMALTLQSLQSKLLQVEAKLHR